MLDRLEPILPHIQNVALALGVLFVAYLLTIPLRRRYASCDGVEPGHRSGRQFIGAVLNYVAFSLLVLVLSLPLIYWLDRMDQSRTWTKYHQAWLSFWGVYALVRLVEGLLVETFVQMGRPCPLSRLTRNLLRPAIMLGVAFLLIRYQLDHKIGVLLTSTAIVTGVIGFAMQGVLGNLLAGMSLHACRSMAVGDWIEVDGTIGQVTLVNWRETRLRTLGGHVVIVPNGKMADATLRNLSSPTSLRRHEVPVSASYGDAPGDVIAALIEAAQSVPMVEKEPAPDAYVTGFKDFCIEYVLRFWSKQYERRTMIEGHVMRMIWYKFTRRGIEIPFPIQIPIPARNCRDHPVDYSGGCLFVVTFFTWNHHRQPAHFHPWHHPGDAEHHPRDPGCCHLHPGDPTRRRSRAADKNLGVPVLRQPA